jgi:hypothetical protein
MAPQSVKLWVRGGTGVGRSLVEKLDIFLAIKVEMMLQARWLNKEDARMVDEMTENEAHYLL